MEVRRGHYTGTGRSKLGMVNSTGCTSVWGSTYPFNPYPFPWTNHLFQDSPSMAMGIFEGHMAKMADGFKAIRMAELELAGKYNPEEHDEFLTYFNWQQFTDEEWELCPPVVAVGGDGAMYDIGFQNLSRMMASGKPVKVLVLDTQVYSNTGGQACTSGFIGQISDMAQYGKAIKGKEEIRKEIGLIGMAHRTTYVMQSTIAHPSHMIEGFIHGLKARRPALFNLYSVVPARARHRRRHERRAGQAGRRVPGLPAVPLRPRSRQDAGGVLRPRRQPGHRRGLADLHAEVQGGRPRTKEMELPLTFADFAVTEVRFRKHFRMAPPDTWNENMVPLAEFLEMDEDGREGLFPYVWSVDSKQRLTRLLVAKPMVESCEDRRDFWTMLRALAGVGKESRATSRTRCGRRWWASSPAGLMQMAGGGGRHGALPSAGPGDGAPPGATAANRGRPGRRLHGALDRHGAVHRLRRVHQAQPPIFAYNEQKKAVIKDPDAGGPYKDLVKAAERCTARVIHPGLPRDRSEKGIDKWIARAEKFN